MEENKNGVQKDEYQVIQETIVPKKKSNWSRWGKIALRTAICAVIFGVVAGVALVVSGKYLMKKLGLEDSLRQIVAIGNTTPTPKAPPTKTPIPSKTPIPTKQPTVTAKPSDAVVEVPEVTPGIIVSIDSNQDENPMEGMTQQETIQEFISIYSSIAELAGNLKKSMVSVTAITEGVDWFEEAYETKESASGLYVGDNGLDMLFLVNLDSIEGATKFEITFESGTTLPCSIYSYDTNYRLAVLSIGLSEVATLAEEELPERAVFALDDVAAGIPVMVLGNPNGHLGAMELGMTTGVSQVVQVIDDEVLYFTTGITKYADGDGFVFNLEGEVIGIVSSTLNKGETGVITAAMVGGMREIIDKTLNKEPRIYYGMRLEAVDTALAGKTGLPEGIYVTEVLPSSPAMTAGIKNGDIITKVGITPVSSVRQFYEEISATGTDGIRIMVSREVKGEHKEQSLFMVPETRLH